VPVVVAGLGAVVAISAGLDHTCSVLVTGVISGFPNALAAHPL